MLMNRVSTSVVDLFCGAGGLAYGLKQAGLNVRVGVDLDANCRHPLEENTGAKFIKRDVTQIVPDELDQWFGRTGVRILAGCAPCQPFSSYTNSRKSVDLRWLLLKEFQRLASALQPEVITLENVPGLAAEPIWDEFVTVLRCNKYNVWWQRVAADDYGVPQKRYRLVLLASKLGPIELQTLAHVTKKTVRQTIGNLPPLKAGEACHADRLHTSAGLSVKNLMRIKASVPGGTWRDWPENLRASCHQKISGQTYPSVYGRMEWDKPSPTITTQCYGFGNGRFGHPEQNRAISLREAALIQSFPENYSFLSDDEPITFQKLGRLIGNAVPPKLGMAIGHSIIQHLNANYDSVIR